MQSFVSDYVVLLSPDMGLVEIGYDLKTTSAPKFVFYDYHSLALFSNNPDVFFGYGDFVSM